MKKYVATMIGIFILVTSACFASSTSTYEGYFCGNRNCPLLTGQLYANLNTASLGYDIDGYNIIWYCSMFRANNYHKLYKFEFKLDDGHLYYRPYDETEWTELKTNLYEPTKGTAIEQLAKLSYIKLFGLGIWSNPGI